MNHRIFFAFVALSLLLPGCSGGNNEKEAAIEGELPKDGLSSEDRLKQMQNSGADVKKAYSAGGAAPAAK